MQPLATKVADDLLHLRGMRNRRKRKRTAWRLGRIDAGLSVDLIQALATLVVRRQRVVIDRPRRRHTVEVLNLLEILTPEAEQCTAPEPGVAADAVMRVRHELTPLLVPPALAGAIAAIFPDLRRAPVLLLLRD